MSTDPDTTTDTPDRSQFIRTYAKDVAALTGKDPVLAKSSKHMKPTPAPKQEEPASTIPTPFIVSGSSAGKEADLSELAREADQISSDEKQESEEDIETQIRTSKNAEPSDILKSISLPDLSPGDIIRKPFEVGTNPSAPLLGAEALDEREAVLARLRAKVASHANEIPVAPEPLPIPPKPEPPPPEPIPVPLPPPQVFVPAPPRPAPEPVAPPPAPKPKKRDKPSPFHSFSSDFSDRIDEQHASKFSVLAAEKDAHPKKQSAPRKKLPLLPIMAGVLLIVIGAGAVFAAYHYLSQSTPAVTLIENPTLIPVNQRVAVSGSGTDLIQALVHQTEQALQADQVLLPYTTESTTTTQGVTEAPATGGALITALNLAAPDILLRNIDPSSMVGILNDGTQTRVFFILRVTSYNRTFAGMLAWEPTIGKDLGALYPAYPAPNQISLNAAPATTTATSTKASTKKTLAPAAPVIVAVPAQPFFIDEVVASHDTRALKDAQGRTILIYGYADQQTLIIARDEAAFTFILSQLTSGGK